MNFQPALAELVMAGQKTVTRRAVSDNPRSPWWRERCRYQPGKVFTVNPGRGETNIGSARVVSLRQEPLGQMVIDAVAAGQPDAEAAREGFESFDAFRAAFEKINRCRWDGSALVWRIEFEVHRA